MKSEPGPGTGPKSAEEWAKVEDYMGLFEHCEIMMENNQIDEETFRDIFSYRINNILANDVIRNGKLLTEKNYWRRFLQLVQRLGMIN